MSEQTKASKADERMRHDYPILQQFHSKHALGALAAPSCLCCGHQTHPVTRPIAVQHMELPAIAICKPCKDASVVRESALASLIAERDALRAEVDRRKGDPCTRLHNLCEAIEEEAASSVFSREEWDRIDAENVELRTDAQRYRFWRKFYSTRFAIGLQTPGKVCAVFNPNRPAVEALGADYETKIDAAIDAAISHKEPT